MVRTGKRVAVLKEALQAAGSTTATAPPPAPRLTDLAGSIASDVLGLYRQLGGVQDTPVLRPGSWDLALSDGTVIELDEELHFNRYRALTLAPAWAAGLPWTEPYQAFCARQESACLAAGAWGKRWTTSSAERLFGVAGPAGVLDGAGAPRWRQRALYDAMKDAAAASGGRRLARVSVYDVVGGHRLWDVLERRAAVPASTLRALVLARVR